MNKFTMSNGCTLGANKWTVPSGSFGLGEVWNSTNGQCTIEIAFRFNSALTSGVILGNGSSRTTIANGYSNFLLSLSSASSFRVYCIKNGATSIKTITLATPSINTDYVFQIVFDGTNIKVYRNGSLEVSVACTGGLAFNSTVAYVLNAVISSGGEVEAGTNNLSIYGLGFYDKALNDDEIATNFDAYVSRYELTI